MHTHFSAMAALGAFLGIVVVGTLWRLIAAHLTAANSSFANHLGKAMAFQY
ncbi:hypothetical protein [Streptomyces sp. WZ-12]|uniref:hypothetical protein n=1 Tax=Streptomyces sp. WZ-12 TaxID=3030210 RepID=UPI002380FE82|nr:hypothetical protein [Streptomyces sp. WZ-12]